MLPTRIATLLSVLLFVLCCHDRDEGLVDGETHFLKACTVGSSDCGSPMTCVCGLCVLPCTDSLSCGALAPAADCVAGAERLPGATCAAPPENSFCDLGCAEDTDCAALGRGYSCQAGACRPHAAASNAGSGGNDGSSGGTASVGTGGEGGETGASDTGGTCLRGEVPAERVVVLGDVFIAQTHDFTAKLESLARSVSSLASDEHYRDYSSTTQNSLAITGALLLDRYEEAKAEGPTDVVIMNGGGSDMLLGMCEAEPSRDCPLMMSAVAGANQLLAQMASDQVARVVWFYYPDPMRDIALRAELDALRPLLQGACEASAVPCYWVELREAFAENHDELMENDFLPTEQGAEVAAQTVWDSMQQPCEVE